MDFLHHSIHLSSNMEYSVYRRQNISMSAEGLANDWDTSVISAT